MQLPATDLPRRAGDHSACSSERVLSTAIAVRYTVSPEHSSQRKYLPFLTPLVRDVGNESARITGGSAWGD